MIAAKLNVSRRTLSTYIHGNPELEAELADRDESMIDLTERSIFDASIGKVTRDAQGRPMPINVNAAIHLLNTKGRSRGYGQHIEVDAPNVPAFTFCRATAKLPEADTGK